MSFKRIGGLWKKDSPSGKKYLSGEITLSETKYNISIWPNDKGDNPKRPDYVITTKVDDRPKSEPDDNEEAPF